MRFSTRIICDIGSGPAVPGNMAHCHPGSLYYILMGLTSRKQANPSICKWGKKMKRGQKMKIVSPKRRMGFPGGASSKESPCQCGRCKRRGSGPWVGKVGNSCQETCVDRGAWRATVHGVTKNQTRLSAHALESTRLLVLLSFSFKIWLSVCCPEWVISVIPIFQVTYSFSCITYCAICCL